MELLVGAFGQHANNDVRAWHCSLCSTANVVVTDEVSPCCRTCRRLRSPLWLRLEDSGVQIELGSRVSHTSAGGSKSVSIVIGINYFLKSITLLRVKAKHPTEGLQEGAVSFQEIVLNAVQLQQLEPLDAEQQEECVLDNYGICGECRGVFRVAQGDPGSQYANDDKVRELEKELARLREKKSRFAREKAYERVFECTEEIKLRTKQILVAKRELEFLNLVICPFCGWLPSTTRQES